MRGSRRFVAVTAIAAAAIGTIAATAQAKGPEDDDDDEGTGSASGLVAPADPAKRSTWLTEKLAAAINPRLRARLSYVVVDLTTGQELATRDADKGMNIASNAKLLTSVAALRTLGAGFRWRTSVHATGKIDKDGTVAGDLYLRGRGDPMLTVQQLQHLAEEVAAAGIHAVDGRLVIDASYFDDKYEPPHFSEQPWEQAGFRAPVAALSVARGAVTVTVVAEAAGKARVTVSPECDYVKIVKDQVTSSREGASRLRIEAKTVRDRFEIEATGVIRDGRGSWDLRKRVDDPARLAGEVFRKALAEHGIRIKRGVASGTVPTGAKPIAAHDSQTLADVLRFMNKASDNTVAETVLKTIGAEAKKGAAPATWADGVAALVAELGKVGVSGFRSDNGSGLFASSEVSARQLVKLLGVAHKDFRIGPDLMASLPVGGVDGTLARRWKGRPAYGRVRAKTGTLEKVSSLSGYVAVEAARPIAFAIIANDVAPGQMPLVKAAADDMVDALVAYLSAR
ncbi:MAG: D-alanyl-D-alanine carboxypeptidase/D-alanyl-D-alanine-endopeptidase [Deltaproteobacteria bacterium]|nr:D-alanyl-D-alanine carboxypeptidase/D-alanyl-D-alanine-endopeptidase [Deltaproteobacteria bacterium]